MTTSVVSLREFITTGALGPLKIGMPKTEVIEVLGEPDWSIAEAEGNGTTYSAFGNIEVYFNQVSPHLVEWFQIERFDELSNPIALLNSRIELDTVGLVTENGPIEFVNKNLWNGIHPEVLWCSDHQVVDLVLRSASIEIWFRGHNGSEIIHDDVTLFQNPNLAVSSIYSFNPRSTLPDLRWMKTIVLSDGH